MNPLSVIAISLGLMTLGMILKSLQISFGQPQGSAEEYPAQKLATERQAYRTLLDSQRAQTLKRQKRVGQYAWLLLAAFLASAWWMYWDTVNKTTASKQISALQTLPVVGSKDIVLSLTLSDGDNIQYLIRSPNVERSGATTEERISKEAVQGWQLTSLGTALNIGEAKMPLGVALNVSK
jgi:hypothetical protein